MRVSALLDGRPNFIEDVTQPTSSYALGKLTDLCHL